MKLIPNIESAWLEYKGDIIEAYAYSDRIFLIDNKLSLVFPANPSDAEELNYLATGKDYQVASDRKIQIRFVQTPTRVKFPINNYTKIPFTIDRENSQRPLLIYTPDKTIELVEDPKTSLKSNQVRFTSETELQCSPDLVGKEITISCTAIFKRFVEDLAAPIKEKISCHLASTSQHQVIQGDAPEPRKADLYSSSRIIDLLNIEEVLCENI